MIGGFVPKVEDGATEAKRASIKRALDYMGLKGGEKIADLAIDRVFIGSCTNGRIEDLRAAAKVVAGHKVSERVNAMVVPGSGLVKAQAEAEGLDKIFTAAGFEWREPGCSMCLAMNPDKLRAGRALRLDLEPQFRGPPGLQGPHPPRLAGDGGGGGDRGEVRRREGVAVRAPPAFVNADAEIRLTTYPNSGINSDGASAHRRREAARLGRLVEKGLSRLPAPGEG